MAGTMRGRPLLPTIIFGLAILRMSLQAACFSSLLTPLRSRTQTADHSPGRKDRRFAGQVDAGSGKARSSKHRLQRSSAITLGRTAAWLLDGAWIGCVAMSTMAMFRAWKRHASDFVKEKSSWDSRRLWTALNVGNHGIYAALFIIRSLFYTGVGSHDRPFYFESYFLGWLCGPSYLLPTMLGWDNNQYNRVPVLNWVTSMNSGAGGAFPSWISACISSPLFMYFYQIAEGTFHLMIVFGGLRAFRNKTWPPPKGGDKQLSLFRWGLWLEILVMDIAYVVAYSCLPMMSLPGHWGLTTIMMLIHHVNVLPDLVCAWQEYKADRAATTSAAEDTERKPAFA